MGEMVYQMLRDGEDVNQRSICGFTALSVACAAGNAELVTLLLEHHADAGLASVHKSELPLHHAARAGHRLVCQQIAELTRAQGKIDAPNNTGWPPLHLAAQGGHSNALSILLRNGADPQCRNTQAGGGTALHLAVRMGAAFTVELLLARGVEVDPLDFRGQSPLHFAAAQCDAPCVSLLIRSNADANQRGPDGQLPLELVPTEHEQYQKVAQLLSVYGRAPPKPMPSHARFDISDPRELL